MEISCFQSHIEKSILIVLLKRRILMKQIVNQPASKKTNSIIKKRTYLGESYPGIYFTVRETQIATLLRQKNYREIAEHYHLSKRTVEYYIETIKYKLKCADKKHLIAKLEIINFFTAHP
jgi:DNA-binding NarL/FixJ family response regulator